MSVIFPYKAFSEVNDFYESIQGIHDSPRNNDNFGKPVSTPIQYANFKNPSFLKEMNALLTNEGGVKKCFSNNSFHENEFNLQMYSRKMSIGCYPENQSSMTSSSSLTSFNSYSSTSLTNPGNNASNSTANTGTANSKSKTKAKKSAKKKKPGEIDYRKKYKTELCKYWAEKGFCEFGDSCAFAHSTTEIRQKIHISSNYKTKQCTSFHELGYCPYGVRCQFIHTLRKEGNVIADFDSMPYAELMENPELWVTHEADCVCLQRQHRPRFPSFVKALSLDSVGENDEANKENNNQNCENCHEIIF